MSITLITKDNRLSYPHCGQEIIKNRECFLIPLPPTLGLSIRFIKANRGEKSHHVLILDNGQDSQLSIYVQEVSDKTRKHYFLGVCMGNDVVYFSFFIA